MEVKYPYVQALITTRFLKHITHIQTRQNGNCYCVLAFATTVIKVRAELCVLNVLVWC